jgi:hypothetical protein
MVRNRIHRTSRVGVAAVSVVAALALAACGSSAGGANGTSGTSGTGTQGSSGGNSNPAEGFTATSVTIEGSVAKTSASGANQALVELGAKARFQRANADGGVNGRKINFLGAIDNKIDPSLDLPISKQIVQQDKAFAAVPVVSSVMSQGGQYLIKNKVPFFGWGINPSFCNNDYAFGFSGCLVPTAKDNQVSTAPAGLVDKQFGIPNGKGKTVALIAEDDTAGSFGIKVMQAAFVADGWDVTYAKATIPSGSAVTDFTPYAQAIMTSNGGKAPDVMFHVTKPPNILGVSTALANAGFKGMQVNAVTYGAAFLANAQSRESLNNEFVFIQYGSFQNDAAANQQMLTDVQAVQPSQHDLTQDIAIGYYSADLFLHDLKKAGKNLSRAGFIKAANDGSSYEVPDGLGAVSFPKDHRNAVPCGSLVQIKGSSFVEKVPLTCFKNVPLSVLGS